MEDLITEEKTREFVERVAKLRGDGNHKNDTPGDVVSLAAKDMGIGSCVQELTYSALRGEVNGATRRVDELRFWVEAACGVSVFAGGYRKDWLDNFCRRFISDITREDDLPTLCDLKVRDSYVKIFAAMLNAAVAFSESKGKVGNKLINKCIGFRAIKYWSEAARTEQCHCGFTDADRAILRSLAGNQSYVQHRPTNSSAGGTPPSRDQYEQLQRDLRSETEAKEKLQTRLCDATRRYEDIEKQLKKSAASVEGLQERNQSLEDKLKESETQMLRERECQRNEITCLKRAIAENENKEAARRENIQEVLTPIFTQMKASEPMDDSGELCAVQRTYLKRIFDALAKNGYSF